MLTFTVKAKIETFSLFYFAIQLSRMPTFGESGYEECQLATQENMPIEILTK
jgi:hypothetical protein